MQQAYLLQKRPHHTSKTSFFEVQKPNGSRKIFSAEQKAIAYLVARHPESASPIGDWQKEAVAMGDKLIAQASAPLDAVDEIRQEISNRLNGRNVPRRNRIEKHLASGQSAESFINGHCAYWSERSFA